MHTLLHPLESRRLLTALPAGYAASDFVTGLNGPTQFAFAPDGRVFAAEQSGDLRLVSPSGALADAPVITLPVDYSGERGLLGVAFDPAFSNNGYLYVYYTATSPSIHNRVSRFTVTGDLADPSTEDVLLDLPTLGPTNHNGGALHFGLDGKLYISTGDNGTGANAPSLDSTLGKILRINPDGSIPADNPFLSQTTGINQAIYARGFRNPFTFAVQPTTGLIYVDDVGENTYEEIDELHPGADYGWPSTEGPTSAPGITAPIYTYKHPSGIAIIGGAFMPDGNYYFGDLSGEFLRKLNVATHAVSNFAADLPALTSIEPGPDGNLYAAERGPDGILRISGNFAAPANTPPTATLKGPPTKFLYTAGKPIAFSFSAKDKEDRKLPAGAYAYEVDQLVGGTQTSVLATGSAITKAKFTPPANTASLGTDVTYRVTLTVTDSGGATSTAIQTLNPNVVTVTLKSAFPKNVAPPALTFTLDGTEEPNLFSFQSIAGVLHTLAAPTTLTGDEDRAFALKSFSGAAKGKSSPITFAAPAKSGALTATYR